MISMSASMHHSLELKKQIAQNTRTNQYNVYLCLCIFVRYPNTYAYKILKGQEI